MGQEIVYCFKCQNRLLGSDFEKGKAFRVGAQVACPDCVRSLLTHLPDPDAELERLKQQAVRKSSGGSSGRIPIVRSPSPESSAKLRAIPRTPAPAAPAPAKSRAALWIGAGVGALVVLILLIAALSGGSKPPPPPPDHVSVTGPPGPKPPAPAPPPVPAPAPEPPKSFAQELDEIDALTLPLIQKEQLREAALMLDAARKRRENPEWIRALDGRIQKLDAAARRLAQPLIDLAVAAAKRKDAAQVEQLRGRVEALGVATASEDFEKAVDAAEPPAVPGTPPKPKPKPKPAPPKPAPPKPATPLDTYRAAWAKALGPAASRDYAASLLQVRQIAAALTDAAAKKEAEEDLADLKLAADALAEVPKLLPRWAKGSKVKLEFIGESGTTELLEGAILDAGPRGVALQAEGGVLDVPAGEIGAGSVAALLALRGDKRPTDARAAALLAALDGQSASSLPDKWKSLPRTPDPAEGEIRRRFWAAEEDFAAMKTRGAAGEIYAVLLAKPSAFALRNKAFLEDRLAATRDFFFFSEDLAGTGTFSPSSSSKIESFWYSTADSAAGKAAGNALEVEVGVQAGAAYKAWVYAGGCCQEVFTFYLQGSGLSGPSAKNPRETVTAEPGGEEWIAVKPPAAGLKKKHSDHTGPKEPDRWVWVELGPLKFAAPGPKKLRLLSEQKGFSVAYLAVSAVRSGQPREGEVKELLKSRPPVDLSPTGTILREIYRGIGGDAIGGMTGSAKFKEGKPDLSGPITHIDSWSMGNDYGCRIRGYVHPPASGEYVFWIASDDHSELWLSTDDTPAKKQRLCGLNHAVDQRKWDADPGQQKSSPVTLVGGKRYYIEVLQKQGGGNEHVAVGWQLPGGALERPIPPSRLSPYGGLLSRRTPRPSFRPSSPEGPLVKSAHIGGTGGSDFSDAPQPRMFLRGFRYSLTGPGNLNALQPLYTGASGEGEGGKFGKGGLGLEIVAKPGYAVGGMVARGTDRLNAFKLVFMRISGARLAAPDRYESDWIGHRGGGEELTLGGDGTPVLGLFGSAGDEIDGAGLLLLGK